MPEVKWVMPDRMIDSHEGYTPAELREVGRVPVLTLDQIEAWLNEFTIVPSSGLSPATWLAGRRTMKAELLAQVQAWKADSQ